MSIQTVRPFAPPLTLAPGRAAPTAGARARIAHTVDILTRGEGLEDSVVQLMAAQAKALDEGASSQRNRIRDRRQQIKQQNRLELLKLEKRAKELEKSERDGSWAKVFKTVVSVVKVVAACVTGDAIGAAGLLAEVGLKGIGKEKLGQMLGSATALLGSPSAFTGKLAEQTTTRIDGIRRAEHARNADHLLADIRNVQAQTDRLTADSQDSLDELRLTLHAHNELYALIQSQIDGQRTSAARALQDLR